MANTLIREFDRREDKLASEKVRSTNAHRVGQDPVHFRERQLFAVRQPAAGSVALSFRKKKIVWR